MKGTSLCGSERLSRLLSGRIEPPEGYVKYSGQVVIRTRYATVQRWKESGWDSRRKNSLPYILDSHYCQGQSDTLKPRNDHLAEDEIEVYYVEDGERIVRKVEPGIDREGKQ